jgi:hypothetical protein
LARIQITGLDAGQSLPVGSALTAGVTGVSAPLSYTWLKNGVPIPGATQSTLTVPNLQPSDAGTYSVVVGTIEGNVSVSAVQVTVSQPPAITTPPQSQSVAVGQSLSFSVTASGTNPTYQWQQNGTAISGATNATYVISNAQMSDAGTYRVIVSAAGVSVESTAAVLTVLAAAPVTRIANVSILTALTSSTDEFTLGYVVGNASGANPLPLVIRAAGPALGAVGVGGTLADPRLQLFAGSTATSDNDNWGGTAVLRNAFASVGAFAFASDTSKDAAALAGITTRDNSVKVSAADGGTGQVIAEIYDATPAAIISASGPRLVNISVLKQIGSGLTVGFVISGTSAKNILIRALGPALSIVAPISAASVIADPRLELFDGKSASIGVNDNWGGTAALRAAFFSAGTFDLVSNSLDAALIGSLSPGSYTVQVKPSTGSSGLGLVEVYELP